MVFLYDPVHNKAIRIAEIASDRLVLVTADPGVAWQQNFVRIDWGTNARAELGARLGELPGPGLEIELGALSLDWLVETGSSGFVPERLASRYFASGDLVALDGAPSIEFSPFVCWSATLDTELTKRLVSLAKQGVFRTGPNWPTPCQGRPGHQQGDGRH